MEMSKRELSCNCGLGHQMQTSDTH